MFHYWETQSTREKYYIIIVWCAEWLITRRIDTIPFKNLMNHCDKNDWSFLNEFFFKFFLNLKSISPFQIFLFAFRILKKDPYGFSARIRITSSLNEWIIELFFFYVTKLHWHTLCSDGLALLDACLAALKVFIRGLIAFDCL